MLPHSVSLVISIVDNRFKPLHLSRLWVFLFDRPYTQFSLSDSRVFSLHDSCARFYTWLINEAQGVLEDIKRVLWWQFIFCRPFHFFFYWRFDSFMLNQKHQFHLIIYNQYPPLTKQKIIVHQFNLLLLKLQRPLGQHLRNVFAGFTQNCGKWTLWGCHKGPTFQFSNKIWNCPDK